MKYLETHFEEYIISSETENLHPKLEKVMSKFPKKLCDLRNIIFYGPSGVGKYTQMLRAIKPYSQTDLKYEKKISITYNKQPYFFKISDIHYEIDMSLLGCNSKLLWHDIYLQIVDIISTKIDKIGIVVCKNFHHIHNELLENFYSYMQQNNSVNVDLKFILITEDLSFISDNILNCCQVVSLARPTKNAYNKCLKGKSQSSGQLENISNIKNLFNSGSELMVLHKIICDKIIEIIVNIEDIKFLKFRDILYDIFIYDLNVNDCVWYIINKLIKLGKIKKEKLSQLLIKTYSFFQYYNNNYRPIYHLENYLLYIAASIHNYNIDQNNINK
jgi:hypothetical protein